MHYGLYEKRSTAAKPKAISWPRIDQHQTWGSSALLVPSLASSCLGGESCSQDADGPRLHLIDQHAHAKRALEGYILGFTGCMYVYRDAVYRDAAPEPSRALSLVEVAARDTAELALAAVDRAADGRRLAGRDGVERLAKASRPRVGRDGARHGACEVAEGGARDGALARGGERGGGLLGISWESRVNLAGESDGGISQGSLTLRAEVRSPAAA